MSIQSPSSPAEPIWKILLAKEASQLILDGRFSGSPDDLRDGFIHLSSASQVAGTLAKHFTGQIGLVAARCDASRLGTALRWETSRGGAAFPHLYRTLRLVDVAMFVPHAEERLMRPDVVAGRI